MKTYAKWAIAILLLGSVLLLIRPKNPHSPIPKEILFAHYRIVTQSKHENIGCGTVIAIGPRQILTARHVIEGGDSYELDLFDEDGNEIKEIPAHLAATGEKMGLDIALLTTDEDLPICLSLDLEEFEVGTWGYAIGCAHGTCPYNVYLGVFSSKHGPEKFPRLSQLAISVPPGESGGGIYNVQSGKLVGIVIGSRLGLTLFIPAKAIREFLSSINH